MKNRTTLLDISFDNFDFDQAIAATNDLLQKKDSKTIFFINADCLYKSLQIPEYKAILQSCDLLLPDGVGLSLAGKLHGIQRIKNCNGTDFSPKVLQLASTKGFPVYFLGGKNNTAKRAANTFQKMFPALKIAGTTSGYHHDWNPIINDIKKSKAKFLFVGMGAPLQERWINKHKEQLPDLLILGVGGLFDYFSGNVARAPKFIRNLKLEWFWRVVQEPGRLFKRYFIDGVKFMRIAFISAYKHPKKNDHQ